MGSVENLSPYLEPVRKSVTVKRTPAEAFEIFTGRIGTWWPLSQFSLHQADAVTCGIEPRVGGHVYEVAKSGERAVWGTVLTWDPPRGFSMTWHPGREPETAQEVELRFAAVPGGTRVDLEHRGWQTYGAEAGEARDGYDQGWVLVFEQLYVGACA